MRQKLALLIAIGVVAGLVVAQLAPGAQPEAMRQLEAQIAKYRAIPTFTAPRSEPVADNHRPNRCNVGP